MPSQTHDPVFEKNQPSEGAIGRAIAALDSRMAHALEAMSRLELEHNWGMRFEPGSRDPLPLDAHRQVFERLQARHTAAIRQLDFDEAANALAEILCVFSLHHGDVRGASDGADACRRPPAGAPIDFADLYPGPRFPFLQEGDLGRLTAKIWPDPSLRQRSESFWREKLARVSAEIEAMRKEAREAEAAHQARLALPQEGDSRELRKLRPGYLKENARLAEQELENDPAAPDWILLVSLTGFLVPEKSNLARVDLHEGGRPRGIIESWRGPFRDPARTGGTGHRGRRRELTEYQCRHLLDLVQRPDRDRFVPAPGVFIGNPPPSIPNLVVARKGAGLAWEGSCVCGSPEPGRLPWAEDLAHAILRLLPKEPEDIQEETENERQAQAYEARERQRREREAITAVEAAERHAEKKDWPRLLAELERIARESPHTAGGRKAKARVESIRSDLSLMRRIAEMTTQRARSWLGQARSCADRGETAKARKLYGKVLAEFSGTPFVEEAQDGLAKL